jgi:hypothetical protein
VYERRPSLRRHTRGAQFANSSVQGVRDRVAGYHLSGQQLLVEPLGNLRPIIVAYSPTRGQKALAYSGISIDIPHGGYYTLEPTEQHGGCKVHCLVWLLLVALCRLACAEEGQESVVQLELHQLCDRQSTITKAEATLGRITRVLYAMTCKMDDVRRFHHSRRVLNSRRPHPLMQDFDAAQASHRSDLRNLLIHFGNDLEISLRSSLLCHKSEGSMGPWEGLGSLLRPQKRSDGRGI